MTLKLFSKKISSLFLTAILLQTCIATGRLSSPASPEATFQQQAICPSVLTTLKTYVNVPKANVFQWAVLFFSLYQHMHGRSGPSLASLFSISSHLFPKPANLPFILKRLENLLLTSGQVADTLEISWRNSVLTMDTRGIAFTDHEDALQDKLQHLLTRITPVPSRIRFVIRNNPNFRTSPSYALASREGSDLYVRSSQNADGILQIEFCRDFLRDVSAETLAAILQDELESAQSKKLPSEETLQERSDAVRRETTQIKEYRRHLAARLSRVIGVRTPQVRQWLSNIDYDVLSDAYAHCSNLESPGYKNLFGTWWYKETMSGHQSPVRNALNQLAHGVWIEDALDSKGTIRVADFPAWMQSEIKANFEEIGSIFSRKTKSSEMELAYFPEFSTWLPVALIHQGTTKSKPMLLRTLLIQQRDSSLRTKEPYEILRIGNKSLRPRTLSSEGSLFSYLGPFIVCGRVPPSEEIYFGSIAAAERVGVTRTGTSQLEMHGLPGRKNQLYAEYFSQNDVTTHFFMIGNKEKITLGIATLKDDQGNTTALLQSHQRWGKEKWANVVNYYKDKLQNASLWLTNHYIYGADNDSELTRLWSGVRSIQIQEIFRNRPAAIRIAQGLFYYVRIAVPLEDLTMAALEDLNGWIAEFTVDGERILMPVLHKAARDSRLRETLAYAEGTDIYIGRFLRRIEFESIRGRRFFDTTISDITQESLSLAFNELKPDERLLVGELFLSRSKNSCTVSVANNIVRFSDSVVGAATQAELIFDRSATHHSFIPVEIRLGSYGDPNPYQPESRSLKIQSTYKVIPNPQEQPFTSTGRRFYIIQNPFSDPKSSTSKSRKLIESV